MSDTRAFAPPTEVCHRFCRQFFSTLERRKTAETLANFGLDVVGVHVSEFHMNDPKIRTENSDISVKRRRQEVKTENSVGRRILEALGSRDLQWLSASARLPINTLRDYVQRGITKTDASVAIASSLGVTVDWLLTGRDLERDLSPRSAAQVVLDALGTQADYLREAFAPLLADPSNGHVSPPFPPDGLISIQTLRDVRASAGDGSIVAGEAMIDSPVAFQEAWLRSKFGRINKLRLIQVGGDSQEPDLRDGDWIMIDEAQNDMRNGLAVIVLDDCLMVKRMQLEGRFLQLMSRNPAYAPIAIDLKKEEDRIRVIGRVVYTLKAA